MWIHTKIIKMVCRSNEQYNSCFYFKWLFFNLFKIVDANGNDENLLTNPVECSNTQRASCVDGDGTTEVWIDGRKMVKKVFDDELQMTFEPGVPLKPVHIGYQVKINDSLSGNMPFKENVRETTVRFILYLIQFIFTFGS